MRFLKENVIAFLCLGVVAWYLFDEFNTTRERVLFIATLIVFFFGMLFSTFIIKYIIADKLSFMEAIIRMKWEIIIWVIAVGALVLFGGIKFAAIWVSGLLLWTILIAGIYWIWIRFRGKK